MSASHPPALTIAFAVLLVALLVPATAIDLRERRIPNRLTGPAALVAIGLGIVFDPDGQIARVITAVGTVVFLLMVRAPRPSGFGLGDVKLAGVLGLCLGPSVVVAVFAAFGVGTAVAVVVAVRHGPRAVRVMTVPFGPYLAGGAGVAFVVGEPVLAAYLGQLG